MSKSIPIVDVYLAKLPKDLPNVALECKERMTEIASVSNEKVKREKYFVWRLLCYALEQSFGMCERELRFTKDPNGIWSLSGVEFSLSHSESALAVAVSHAPIGIDIERIYAPKSKRIAERVMASDELSLYESLPEDRRTEKFIEIWTAKEAIFKSRREKEFLPTACNTLTESVKTYTVTIDGEKYAWSVATATPEKIRIFSDIDLSE